MLAKKVLFTVLIILLIGVLSACAVFSLSQKETVSPDPEIPGTAHAETGYIVVRGFEWGPGVNELIIELDSPVDYVEAGDNAEVYTAHYDRTITDIYLSDDYGNEIPYASRYVTIMLETSFEATGSPFEQDMDTEHNEWADEYIVKASFRTRYNGLWSDISFEGDCIENRLCPELDRFGNQGTFSGDYENPLTGETETLSLNYAAYEPDTIAGWDQNPLIIWLHGRGEGGDDITKTILGNEVSALTESQIQSYFVSGDQVGAYVLVVQCPTYWLDPGTGEEGRGDLDSRYTEALYDLIWDYIRSNSDIDPERIYLMGASNGGFMTMDMLVNYPDFFAAAVPISEPYAYYEYAKRSDGTYVKYGTDFIRTETVSFTDADCEALLQTPIWFVQAMTDNLVDPTEFMFPVYQQLLQAGADNCWCSLYMNVYGSESHTMYLGHWSWVYVLNDQVRFVQNRDTIINSTDNYMRGFFPNNIGGTRLAEVDGKTYYDLFTWLADQTRVIG